MVPKYPALYALRRPAQRGKQPGPLLYLTVSGTGPERNNKRSTHMRCLPRQNMKTIIDHHEQPFGKLSGDIISRRSRELHC